VSGVGHETDFSICDFVADLRAATPTAAAVAASPDREALAESVAGLRRRLARDARRSLDMRAQRLDGLARRLLTPSQRLERDRERLVQFARRLRRAIDIPALRRDLERVSRHLAHLDPTQVLGRGYSIVRDADGHVRHSSAGLEPGNALDITFAEGGAGVTVRDRR